MLTVHTTLTRSSACAAVMARLLRPRVLLHAWATWTVVVAGLIAVTRGAPKDAIDGAVLAVSAGAGALLSVAASLAFTLLRVRSRLKPNDGVLGDHVYEVRPEGLREKTAVNETLTSWAAVHGVLQTDRFAFIELRSGSFHIIPRASFGSSQEEQGFLSEVRRRATSAAAD